MFKFSKGENRPKNAAISQPDGSSAGTIKYTGGNNLKCNTTFNIRPLQKIFSRQGTWWQLISKLFKGSLCGTFWISWLTGITKEVMLIASEVIDCANLKQLVPLLPPVENDVPYTWCGTSLSFWCGFWTWMFYPVDTAIIILHVKLCWWRIVFRNVQQVILNYWPFVKMPWNS